MNIHDENIVVGQFKAGVDINWLNLKKIALAIIGVAVLGAIGLAGKNTFVSFVAQLTGNPDSKLISPSSNPNNMPGINKHQNSGITSGPGAPGGKQAANTSAAGSSSGGGSSGGGSSGGGGGSSGGGGGSSGGGSSGGGSSGGGSSGGGGGSSGGGGGSSGGGTSLSLASQILGDYTGATDYNGAIQVGNLIGHHLQYAMDFGNGTSWSSITSPTYPWDAWIGKGFTMIWGIDMLPNTYKPDSNISDTSGSAYGLWQGAQGQFNSYFKTVAQNLVNAGFGYSVIRLGWEFNGGWFPWAANGQQTDFINYWHNIVDSMRSVPGQHFLFEWNPTIGNLGVGNLASYYPGNSYVDWVGLDVYDITWSNYPGCSAEWNYLQTETYGLNWLVQFGASVGKPLTLPEWGIGDWGVQAVNCGTLSNTNQTDGGGDDPIFVNGIYNFLNSHNFVEATVWDNGSKFPQDPTAYPNATQAFINDFSH